MEPWSDARTRDAAVLVLSSTRACVFSESRKRSSTMVGSGELDGGEAREIKCARSGSGRRGRIKLRMYKADVTG